MKISEQVSDKTNALEEARKDLNQKMEEVNAADARVQRLKKAIRLKEALEDVGSEGGDALAEDLK